MATGISLVTGNKLPKTGETNFYEVAGFYPGTTIPADESAIKWKLFVEESTGNWRELRGEQKTGRRVPFSFPQQWYGKKLLIEAYLNNSEKKSPPGIIVMPVGGDRKIDKISFFDSNWNALRQNPKYGQTLNVRIETVNMLGETLRVSLWERDTYSDTGHDPEGNVNIWGTEKSYKVQNANGKVEFSILMDPSWAILAGNSIFEGGEHEYYLLVKGFGATTKYSSQRNVNNEIDTSPAPPNSAPRPVPATNRPASPSPVPSPNPSPPRPSAPSSPRPATPSNNSPATNPPAAAPQPVSQQEPVKVEGTGANPPAPSGGVSPATVNEVKVEGLTDAYFAKKEFTKKTGEEASTFEYPITSDGNKTATDAEKDRIAGIILEKASVKALKEKKEYTTKEAIKAGLVQNVYNKKDKVTFKTFKLGEEFKKIPSAPLEDKVYLVATSYFLEGKTATIVVKEKDGIIGGSADAVLPISQISEEKMTSTEALTEADRTEKTEFTGTIEKIEVGKDAQGNAIMMEMIKIPVQLSPKTDADLKIWKDKLGKGKKDEYIHKYTPANSFTVDNERELNSIAETIVKKCNESKELKDKSLVVNKEDIVAILKPQDAQSYGSTRYSEVTPIPTYKKVPELLWLNAKATGEKEHNKDFLKAEGAYFSISKGKYIIFPLLIKPRNDIEGANKGDYWAADNKNQTNYQYSRGSRLHAARDLETEGGETVVAIAGGKVLEAQAFYRGTHQVTIHHKIPDGREFIVRYGELDPNSLKVQVGDEVTQKQELGKTGKMTGISRYMVHFEQYTGAEGFEVTNYRLTQENNPPFSRRKDLIDSLEILQEGYRNTFGEDTGTGELFTVEDGKQAVTDLYNKYKDNTWNWKWEGSEEEVVVTGKQLLTIVEKMYRLETAHFTSKQYQNCGTGGMEAFGSAPYYGWDSTLFVEQPVGTWSAFEGAGLSGSGGNAQVTDRPKEFIKFPSVAAGMEYKIKYIIKYNGNYARWFNTNTPQQETYRATLNGIRARFIEEL